MVKTPFQYLSSLGNRHLGYIDLDFRFRKIFGFISCENKCLSNKASCYMSSFKTSMKYLSHILSIVLFLV